MAEETEKKVFDESYVKELRNENATWRTKVRDLELKLASQDISIELVSRGIKVEPKWIDRNEGQSASEAVDSFLEKYPQFSSADTHEETVIEDKPEKILKAKPMASGKPDTNKVIKPTNSQGRGLDEIKKDPKARANLRQQYRSLLAQSSNKDYEGV